MRQGAGRAVAALGEAEAMNALRMPKLACNLANFLRTLALPRKIAHLRLTSLREKLVKIAAKVVQDVRHVIFRMAEVAVPLDLFRRILERIDDLNSNRRRGVDGSGHSSLSTG